MSDEFVQPPQFESRRESATPVWLLIGAAVAVVAIVGLFVYRALRKPAPPPAPVAAAAPAEAPPAAAPAVTPAAPAEPLPALDDSDPFVRERLGALSSDSLWARLLAGEGLVRRFTATLLSIDERRNVRDALADVAPGGSFRVVGRGGRQYIDPASFARFDPWVRVISALDPGTTAVAWHRISPLAGSAWREMAPPERTLDQAVGDAIDHLLQAPLAPESIEVVPQGVVYAYADRNLESLSPAQKLLVRTGRANQTALRAWLEALRARL